MDWIRRIFRRNRITLNRVRDTVYFVESGEEIEMRVDEDPIAIGRKIKRSMDMIEGAKKDDSMAEAAARQFIAAVFGDEQTDRLVAFYHGNFLPAFEITSKYMSERLLKKIVKAQKNAKVV